MPDVFTIYYRKKYRAVFITTVKKRASIMAHSIALTLKEQLDVKEKTTVFIDHRGNKHLVFVKCPYDKRFKKE